MHEKTWELNRRAFLASHAGGLGALALASLLHDNKLHSAEARRHAPTRRNCATAWRPLLAAAA